MEELYQTKEPILPKSPSHQYSQTVKLFGGSDNSCTHTKITQSHYPINSHQSYQLASILPINSTRS